MPTILKIGYQCFLVSRAADAAKVVTALAGAVAMKEGYDSAPYFYPDEEINHEIAMVNVPACQILATNPKEAAQTIDVAAKVAATRPQLTHRLLQLRERNL